MPIGEIFLAAFIKVLFEKLASTGLLKFARREQVHTHIKRWSGELTKIQAFLADAEGKQIENRAVKVWLEELTDLAYDLDDILDEFATEALRRKLTSESQAASTSKSKLRTMIPTCCKGLNPTTLLSDFTRSSTSKIEEITTRLKNILERGSGLGLQQIVAGEFAKAWHRPPSTSLIHEPRICGRDKEKKEIIDFLLRNESSDNKVSIIPIVGMGGLGKTTLAQMVYNDEVVNKNFDLKAWVCVSDEFDILRISKVILESITSKSCEFKELNQVQVQLKQNLVGKKILIVLDDVWDKKYNDWNVLKSPFNDGAPGSKIIVTTRDKEVASIMGTIRNHLLQHLSDDDCWSVFEQHAFGNRSLDENPNLVFIGRKIVENCKGLPLAARTLGGLLRCKERDDEWKIVLNSKLWDLTEQGNEIPPALRLSYHHLPSHLKQCFAYCSILPKDYEFEEMELVFLWMAEGLLQQQNGEKQMEDLGVEYFRELQSRSFFQPSSSGESSKFVMHDLINDLAQSVAGYTCFRLEDKLKDQEQCRKLKSARHSSYMQSNYDAIKKFETFYEAENVRTFLPLSPLSLDEYGPYYLTSNVPLNLLPKMKRLRVLSLNRYHIGELIPKSIGDLKHLRYLNFSYTRIRTIPESLGTLYNLQTLMLRGCRELRKLPADMGNLINLRHLDMTDSNSLEEMPRGIGKLTSLQTLSNFIVMKDDGFRIRELGNLIHLGGKLCILGIENVVDPLDARWVCLNEKQGIDVITMVWSSESLDGLRNEMVETEVLGILQPHKKLKELYIRGYHGMRFPIWTGDPLFSNMVCMKLQNCKNCTSLPPLGQLPSLKDLHIEGMSVVKHVGCEFYGQHCAKPFPLLETLCFENMSEWEDWYIFGIDKEVQTFTQVSKLSIKKCPKLVGMLPSNLPCLKTLEITNCPQLLVEALSLVLPSLTSLSMSDVRLPSLPVLLETCNVLEPSSLTCLNIRNVSIPESLCNPSIDDEVMLANAMSKHLSSITSLSIEMIQKLALLPKWLTQGLKGLEELKISSCEELTTLWQNEEGLQHSLLALQSLEIDGCPQLVSLFEEDEDVENEGQHQLEYLEISDCKKLEKLPRGLHTFTSLRRMSIGWCPSLVSFSETGFPPSLKQLWISTCEALRSLPRWTAHDSNLESLEITSCDDLESLWEEEWVHHPPTKLSSLIIGNCKKLESVPSLCNNSLLASLKHLEIERWPAGGGIVSSYILEKGNFLTNLTLLSIANMKIGKPLLEWGLHRFSSLNGLWLQGPSNVSSSSSEEKEYYSVSSFPVDGMLLPTSLMKLGISNFPNLEKISSSMETIQNLNYLYFCNCPRLASFPEQGGLPPSLLDLRLCSCPIMKQRCEKGKGQYWPLIAPIPRVTIDGRCIFEEEGERPI